MVCVLVMLVVYTKGVYRYWKTKRYFLKNIIDITHKNNSIQILIRKRNDIQRISILIEKSEDRADFFRILQQERQRAQRQNGVQEIL